MPQLDPATFLPQLVWLAITFVVLYLILARVTLPGIADVLERRRQRIDGNLEKAEALKAEAEAAREAYEKALEAARTEAHARLTETAGALAREAAERHRALAATLAGQAREAERRIAEAKEKALKSVRMIAAEIAGQATEKVIGTKVDEKSVEAAVDATLRRRD